MALRADDVDLGRDRDLVVRSQSGDDGAFEDLYRRYFDRLYRFCLRRLGDPHEAEELTQETFARAYGALPKLAGERRFYPWLSVIASRLCVDEYRRRARSEPVAVIDLGGGDGGQERVLQAIDADLLGRAMTRLTPRHQDVLRLREHEGWSYQHIADHMGVNLGTVEALLHRARRALKREFDVLSGPERAPVVVGGVGLLARLARRLQSLRAKVAGCDEAWVPLLGNAMIAAVVVVVMGATVGGGTSASTPGTTLSLVPAAASRMAGEGTGAAKATALPRADGAATQADRGGSSRSFRPGEDVGAGGVLLWDDDERPKDQPTVVDVMGVTVSADVDTAVEETTQSVDSWREDLEEEAP